jgi:hypothetical protein
MHRPPRRIVAIEPRFDQPAVVVLPGVEGRRREDRRVRILSTVLETTATSVEEPVGSRLVVTVFPVRPYQFSPFGLLGRRESNTTSIPVDKQNPPPYSALTSPRHSFPP